MSHRAAFQDPQVSFSGKGAQATLRIFFTINKFGVVALDSLVSSILF
jgi:hypothetical protein